MNISSIYNLKNPPWNFLLIFVSRIVVNECLKNSVQNCFSFPLSRISGRNIKILGFHNNTHLLDLSSLHVSFRTLPNMPYFRKTLHFRYLRGLWIHLCHIWHKFSIYIMNQVTTEHIPINLCRFFLRGSSEESCIFVGLKTIFPCL